MNTTLLITEDQLKQLTALDDNIDLNFVSPHVLTVQDKYVHEKLGSQLYREIQTQVENDSLTAANQLLLEDHIVPVLAHFTVWRALPFLGTKFVNSGVVRRSVDDGDPLSLNEIDKLAEREKQSGEWYLQRMIDFLCHNSTDYPLYRKAQNNDVRSNTDNYNFGLNLSPIRKTKKNTAITKKDIIENA